MPEPGPAWTLGLQSLTLTPSTQAWNLGDYPADCLPPVLRPAAVLVGLRRLPQPRLILTVRTDTLQAHAGQVALPGGRVDPDDADALAAALREAEEEVALQRHWIQPLGYLERYATLSGYLITPVVAWIDPAACCVPQPAEVAEVFEVPLAFLQDPGQARYHWLEYRGHRRRCVEFSYQGHRIWGATAAILERWLSSSAAGYAAPLSACVDQHV